MIIQGKSSDIIFQLYGSTKRYQDILKPYIKKLVKEYPSNNLKVLFETLGKKFITVMPMKLCEAIMNDFGKKPTNSELSALGLHMLAISTHDDVVDEMSQDKINKAALIYSGNLTSNKASQILMNLKDKNAGILLLDLINQNHFYQQIVVETLWTKKPKTFSEYTKGINHICTFTEIGLQYGLALCQKQVLKNRIKSFAINYGLAIQMIDDLREVEEDKKFGYWSYPVIEGFPYTKTISELNNNVINCKKSIPIKWKNINKLIYRLERFALKINE